MLNGKDLFLSVGHGNSVLARRYRDVLTALVSDIGNDPSEAQAIICRRAATLACWCEQVEADMAAGNPIDVGRLHDRANSCAGSLPT